jgi:hypothetical protein
VAAVAAGDMLTTMCRGSLASEVDSVNGPLTVPGEAEEAEEAEESRPSGPGATLLGILDLLYCLG